MHPRYLFMIFLLKIVKTDDIETTTIDTVNENGIIDEKEDKQLNNVIIRWNNDSVLISDFYINYHLVSPAGTAVIFIMQSRFQFLLPEVNLGFVAGRALQERLTFYEQFESFFSHFDMDGKTCVLRAICENSEYEIVSAGILAEFLSVLLRVTASEEDLEALDYRDAHRHGEEYGNCYEKYQCPMSLYSWAD